MVDYCECCGHPLPSKELMFDACFDEFSNSLERNGNKAKFTPLQARLVLALFDFNASPKTKEYLHSEMYSDRFGYGVPEIKIVDVAICQARKKLSDLGIAVKTEWGRGYYLELVEGMRASA